MNGKVKIIITGGSGYIGSCLFQYLGWTLGAISGKIISTMIANENTNLNLEPYSSKRLQ